MGGGNHPHSNYFLFSPLSHLVRPDRQPRFPFIQPNLFSVPMIMGQDYHDLYLVEFTYFVASEVAFDITAQAAWHTRDSNNLGTFENVYTI